jgi:hypothetical protein
VFAKTDDHCTIVIARKHKSVVFADPDRADTTDLAADRKSVQRSALEAIVPPVDQ